MSRRMTLFAAILGTVPILAGCERPTAAEPSGSPEPAKVEKLPGEADLTTIHLSEEANRRLRIATTPVERRPVGRVRTYGGEVVVPPGRAVAVSAPLNGTVLPPSEGSVPMPGAPVRRGQEVFRLLPLISPEAQATLATTRVEAQGQVDQAEKQLAQAKIQLDRAERLHRDNLGGSGALADAQAQYDIADSTLRAAVGRRDAVDAIVQGIQAGTLDALSIEAEADGSIRGLHVKPGQVVAAGAPLFDIEELDPIWVRVPVYVGERRDLDPEAEVLVGELGAAPDTLARSARPVPAPPSGDPLAASVDLYYEVPNGDRAFWPGQRVGVAVPLRGQRDGLVVPRAAVIYDYHGGTWVYRRVAPQTYSRLRVRVAYVSGDLAILLDGPEPGAEVVTDGAAELFGTEFGGGK